MCIGDKYPDSYVLRLQKSVRENLSIPHRFVCITDREIHGVATMPPPTEHKGWWGKVGLFSGIATDCNLWLDLDVVITGSLDVLIEQYGKCELAMPENWAQSGHGGCQSSVMVWDGTLTAPHDLFDPKDARWPPVNDGGLWGDQDHITRLRDQGKVNVTHTDETLIRSYKYHCRNGLPHNCRVVVFHGKPDPHEVKEEWFTW